MRNIVLSFTKHWASDDEDNDSDGNEDSEADDAKCEDFLSH